MTTSTLAFIDLTLATTRQARLKLVRKARGILSKEVAVYLGVSPAAVTRWENEHVPEDQAGITIDKLYALCRLYKVNLEWVVSGTLPIEPAESTPPQVDPLQAALNQRLLKMAEESSPKQGQAALTSIQSLVLSQFLEGGISETERELLNLYARTVGLSHLPGYEFMIMAIRAALSAFLASNPAASSLHAVTSSSL
jgi:transcriptional regulator with XRE-family HTH domain